MNRREAIQRTAMVLGYAVTGPALIGIMKGCKAEPELNYTPVFFTKDQAALVSTLSEIIIPKTSTPGAIDAGVPAFIEGMVKECYPKADQDRFMKGLAAFDDDAKKDHGSNFIDLSKEDQTALVKKYHEALASASIDRSAGWWRTGGGEKPFIVEFKELTLLGFFTSEPGATQVLQYQQVPGPYKGCVPLADVGKAWAT